MAYDNRFLREAFRLVPSIGSGRRWYDFPYNFLNWVLRSRIGRKFPRLMRSILLSGLNYFHPFNQHDRNRVWSRDDRLHNVNVPAGEHVTVPGIWVVEFFPPSELELLIRSFGRNSWDSERVSYGSGETNTETLERTRSGQGSSWWRVGSVTRGSGTIMPDAIYEKLHPFFSAVEISASHMGDGLTAVGAFFRMSDDGKTFLDGEWHKSHEPRLVWHRGRPRAEDRMWAAFWNVQQARRRLHVEARTWMTRKVPGAFSRRGVQQPLIDLLLLAEHDPLQGNSSEPYFSESLRAIGIMNVGRVWKSESFPGLLLNPAKSYFTPSVDENTWALWGNTRRVVSVLPSLGPYGGPNGDGIANRLNDEISATLTFLALSSYLEAIQVDYAEMRDEARMRHGKFRARRLKRVRNSFLSISLDLSSAVRDVKSFHVGAQRFGRIPEIVLEDSPDTARQLSSSGHSRTPINLTERVIEHQSEVVAKMMEEDRDYREIISAVASLGATIETFKLGRVALWVSLVSLAVSLVALLLAEVQSDTVLSHLVGIFS